MSSNQSRTGVIYQNFRLYLEGIQIPFESIVINQGVGSLPTAMISIPPQAGLMDIARFYSPKVHIFFTDNINHYADQNDRARDKLLFSGIIQSTSYSKSKNGSGSIFIQFNCIHRNYLISECLIDYTGYLTESTLSGSTGQQELNANSQAAILESLKGILPADPTINSEMLIRNANGDDELNPKFKVTTLPKSWNVFKDRLSGMTGLLPNYWNQLLRAAYNIKTKSFNKPFTDLYRPLIEDGLQFFQRLSGHPSIDMLMQDDKYREDACPKSDKDTGKLLIPPCNKLFLKSAIQTTMTVALLETYLQTSGEVTNIYNVYKNFYESIDYDLLTLASPAEAPLTPTAIGDALDAGAFIDSSATAPIDTIVKPKLPFYYAPLCNVLLPGMYHTINVSYDEINIPTRVDIANAETPSDTVHVTNFRAPHSVREAISKAATADYEKNLSSTMGKLSFGAIGQYEYGRGIKASHNFMPPWLGQFSASSHGEKAEVDSSKVNKDTDPENYEALRQLQVGWDKRFPGDTEKNMNPWSESSGLSAHHKIMISASEYYYSQLFASSKAGSVECPFNPYLIPGYPLDIIEASPNLPSFHALCNSVTHSISSSGLTTSVSFAAATTYQELANYYCPFVTPFLQVALGLAENPTIVNNTSEAIDKANDFYYYTLGVTAAPPESLFDFSSNRPKPIQISADGRLEEGSANSITGPNGGELNPNLTFEGNLSLTQRPIENKVDIEKRFGIKFIDMVSENYPPTAIKYSNSAILDDLYTKFEIGRSMYLDYSRGETGYTTPIPYTVGPVATPAPVTSLLSDSFSISGLNPAMVVPATSVVPTPSSFK